MKDSPKSIFRYAATGFAITVVLVSVKILVEHTYWGHRTERSAFEFLQSQIPFLIEVRIFLS